MYECSRANGVGMPVTLWLAVASMCVTSCSMLRVGTSALVRVGRAATMRREVLRVGFPTTLQRPPPVPCQPSVELQRAVDAVDAGRNVVVAGCAGTGKRTLVSALKRKLSHRRVAVTSSRADHAAMLDGLMFVPFLGMRPHSEVLSVEQAVGSIERHTRLMRDTYGELLPTIETCDVLIIDALENVPPPLLEAMDAVAREVRGVDAPFGGLQVVATANFYRQHLPPTPSNTGCIFQLRSWNTLFEPRDQIHLHHVWSQSADDVLRTQRALHGTLTDADTEYLTGTPNGTQLEDNWRGRMQWHSPFPLQPSQIDAPQRLPQIKGLPIGVYLTSTLSSMSSPAAYGLPARLNVSVGDFVTLLLPLLDGERINIPRGEEGVVQEVADHFLTVFFPNVGDTMRLPRVRVEVFHETFPLIKYWAAQFPVAKRSSVFPSLLINEELPPPRDLFVDGNLLTDPNDLGNIMCLLSTLQGRFNNLDICQRRDGIIHEPTRIYTQSVIARQNPKLAESVGFSFAKSEDRWCKNCKTHVRASEFVEHWDECVQSVQWCADCSVPIPASKWTAHCEKHTIVMCLDCGKSLEWKFWDAHRLTCGAMLRELTVENELLPSVTRDSALYTGHDRTDLHTVKSISRSLLPKRHTDVSSGAHSRPLVR